MIWDQMTSDQIEQLDKNIPVVLVMAATEQHGPHLPLATDRIIGEYFAHTLNDELSEQVIILPTISVGCSSHHMAFPGTLSLSHNSFYRQVKDIIESVIHHGFCKIIFLNSHGGNVGISRVLMEQLGYQFPDTHFIMATWWRIAASELKGISETETGGTGHACEFETSLMMLIASHLVLETKIQSKCNIPSFPWAESDMLQGPEAEYYRPIKKMTPSGVYGEPMAASAEKGKQISKCVIAALIRIIKDLKNI